MLIQPSGRIEEVGNSAEGLNLGRMRNEIRCVTGGKSNIYNYAFPSLPDTIITRSQEVIFFIRKLGEDTKRKLSGKREQAGESCGK